MITYDPKRWWHVLLSFPRSRVFLTLALDVVLVGAYAALVVWFERDVARIHDPLGPAVLSLLGIILGLLLVFRTNTAYDRWWEGRRLWGQLVNVSRALAHALDGMLPPDAESRRTYAELLAVFPAALAAHLRLPLDAGSAPREHVPNATVQRLSRAVHADVRGGQLPAEAIVALTPLVSALDDVAGGCERIRRTPIPVSYSSYIKQFVVFYALLVPFGLAGEFGYGTVLAEMFIFFSTMGVELLATEIEEPFGTDPNDLPTDDIAATIAADVSTILGASGAAEPAPLSGGRRRSA